MVYLFKLILFKHYDYGGDLINDLPQITDKMEIPLEFSATSGLEDEEIIK